MTINAFAHYMTKADVSHFSARAEAKKERPTEDFYDRNMTQKAELIDTRAVKKKIDKKFLKTHSAVLQLKLK